MIFSLRAAARLGLVRPTPTTRCTARARFSASANEPPIKPTPITTSLRIFSLAAMSAADHLGQRGEEAGILRFQPDRDPQVPGHAIARERPHDYTRPQQLLERRAGVSGVEAYKVAVGRNVLETQPLEPLRYLANSRAVAVVALADEIRIVQRRGGGGKGHAVHVERLAHAVHEVRDARRCEGVAHAQSR